MYTCITRPQWVNTLRSRQNDSNHDDVIKWKHFPRNWPFVREIHRSPVNFPHKGQWRGALMFSLIYAWINDWANNREAGDLRRQQGHYDVIVMFLWNLFPAVQLSINQHLVMHICITQPQWINTLRPKENSRHFVDGILKCIFLNENVWILNKISLKFVPKGLNDDNSALVEVMTWCQGGDKPLPESVMPQSIDPYMCHLTSLG